MSVKTNLKMTRTNNQLFYNIEYQSSIMHIYYNEDVPGQKIQQICQNDQSHLSIYLLSMHWLNFLWLSPTGGPRVQRCSHGDCTIFEAAANSSW